MSPRALVLVLASAILHAGWNAFLKRERDVEAATYGMQVLTTAAAILLALADPGGGFGDPIAVAWAVAAGLCEASYFVALAAALSRTSLALAYTVSRGGSLLVLWPVSLVFLGEKASLPALLGAAVLVAGLAVVSSQGATQMVRGSGGLARSALCALAIAGYGITYKQALAHGAAPTTLFALSLAISAPVTLVGLRRLGQARRAIADRPLPLLLASLACAASFVLTLLALRFEGAGAVMTLRNTSVVFALGFSAALGERPGPRPIAGSVLVAAGAVLIGWPR